MKREKSKKSVPQIIREGKFQPILEEPDL